MRWTSWWPAARPRHLNVLGLDVGPDGCSLVVLSGSARAPDSVCCSERLTLPAGWVEQGEVLQSTALGQWLRGYLETGDYQPQVAYVGLDGACVSHHRVTIAAGLSSEDVTFQLLAEVQAVLPAHAADVCIDYTLDTEPAPEGVQCYVVQAAPRSRVQDLLRVVELAGLTAAAVEPGHDAARRSALNEVLRALPQASAALALQCEEAFGLALRAWHETGVNFLLHREEARHLLRRAWLLGVAVCVMGGAFLAAGFAIALASAAERNQPDSHEVVAKTLDISDSFVNLPAVGLNGFASASFAVSIFNSAKSRFLNLELSELEADGKDKVVSSPRVGTVDQSKAVIVGLFTQKQPHRTGQARIVGLHNP